MKKISEHLGEIIVALACVALLISAVTVFAAPVGDFFGSIVTKEVALGNEVMAGIENIDTSNIGVDGNGSGGSDEGASQTYQIIAGSGQTYSTGTLSFTSNAPYSKFAGVKVNGAIVDPVNYTVTEGSTIITFTEEYSKVLANGDYEIEVLATDGKASAPFDVNITEEEPELDEIASWVVGDWTDERGHFVTMRANGTGVMMDWETSDEATVVITFNYALVEGEDTEEIAISNINITKHEGSALEMEGALGKGGYIVREGQFRIGSLTFKTQL